MHSIGGDLKYYVTAQDNRVTKHHKSRSFKQITNKLSTVLASETAISEISPDISLRGCQDNGNEMVHWQ